MGQQERQMTDLDRELLRVHPYFDNMTQDAKAWRSLLKGKGVRLLDWQTDLLQCMACEKTWRPKMHRNGQQRANRYWLCPHHACNRID